LICFFRAIPALQQRGNFFLKIIEKIFGGYKHSSYLCITKQGKGNNNSLNVPRGTIIMTKQELEQRLSITIISTQKDIDRLTLEIKTLEETNPHYISSILYWSKQGQLSALKGRCGRESNSLI